MFDKKDNYKDKTISNIEKFGSWLYNVRDKYKPLSQEEIKEDLRKNSLPGAILMSHIEGDFNFANIIRTANSFAITNIFYYGKRKFDRRGACGSYHYVNINYLSSIEEVKILKGKYVFVGIENNIKTNPILIKDFEWKTNSLLVFGEENSGISKDLLPLLDFTVEIPSFGSVRSLNVGSAAAIAIYDYWNKIK